MSEEKQCDYISINSKKRSPMLCILDTLKLYLKVWGFLQVFSFNKVLRNKSFKLWPNAL